MKPSPSTARSAFTLIELLVVITIIGILASIFLPAIGRARASAYATECRNNLRTLGLALRMYTDESDQYPIAYGSAIVGFGSEWGVLAMADWKYTLVPWVGVQSDSFVTKAATMRTLRCPLVLRKEDGARANSQYAYNASGTARFQDPINLGLGGYKTGTMIVPTAESQVRAPSNMIAIWDVSPGDTMELPPGFPLRRIFGGSDRFDVCSTNRMLWPGSPHGGAANLLFVDGHVETGRQTNWVAATDTARRRWNNDHQPHPETWSRN